MIYFLKTVEIKNPYPIIQNKTKASSKDVVQIYSVSVEETSCIWSYNLLLVIIQSGEKTNNVKEIDEILFLFFYQRQA